MNEKYKEKKVRKFLNNFILFAYFLEVFFLNFELIPVFCPITVPPTPAATPPAIPTIPTINREPELNNGNPVEFEDEVVVVIGE